MSEKDEEILKQTLSEEELNETSGGTAFTAGSDPTEEDWFNCVYNQKRKILKDNGEVNCAATVEDGSWCHSNDACFGSAVNYFAMKDCSKAWK